MILRPIAIAMALAARAKGWELLAGAVALPPFQAWGIAFDFLMQVGIKLGPEIIDHARANMR